MSSFQKVIIGRATLYLGDSADVLPHFDPVDSVVCDPPYGISFMGKAWDYDVPQAALWSMVLDVMKPGAHLISFAGSRTYHRMACQVEDGGFEIRDQIMWLYGSGFPKNHNISKAIQAKLTTGSSTPTAQRKAAMGDDYVETSLAGTPGYGVAGNMFRSTADGRVEHEANNLAVSAPEALEWQGWGTALKPAHEPCVLARKPFKGSCTDNVLEHGCGALNIDGCRVPASDQEALAKNWDRDTQTDLRGGKLIGGNDAPMTNTYSAPTGRWPANLIHDGTADLPNFFYVPKVSAKERGTSTHPTMKPIALMSYLCRLVTPKGGVVLDCFMGSGSTGVAALSEGFSFVGVERDPEYFEIACARLREAQGL